MSYRHLFLILLLCLPAHAAFAGDTRLGESCDLKDVFAVTNKQEFMDFDAALRGALKSGDPAALALLIQFPLTVTKRGGTSIAINNAETLQSRLAETFSQDVRQAVLDQDTKELFCKDGWVGYDNGAAEVVIKQVDVGSAKEFRVTNIAILDEGSSESSQKNRIGFICHTPKYRIVVDSASGDGARYRAWIKPHTGLDKPDMEIDTGAYDIEGTGVCGRSVWTFKNSKTTYEVGELGCTDGSEPKGSIGSVNIAVGDKPVETLWCYD